MIHYSHANFWVDCFIIIGSCDRVKWGAYLKPVHFWGGLQDLDTSDDAFSLTKFLNRNLNSNINRHHLMESLLRYTAIKF